MDHVYIGHSESVQDALQAGAGYLVNSSILAMCQMGLFINDMHNLMRSFRI